MSDERVTKEQYYEAYRAFCAESSKMKRLSIRHHKIENPTIADMVKFELVKASYRVACQQWTDVKNKFGRKTEDQEALRAEINALIGENSEELEKLLKNAPSGLHVKETIEEIERERRRDEFLAGDNVLAQLGRDILAGKIKPIYPGEKNENKAESEAALAPEEDQGFDFGIGNEEE